MRRNLTFSFPLCMFNLSRKNCIQVFFAKVNALGPERVRHMNCRLGAGKSDNGLVKYNTRNHVGVDLFAAA